MEKNEILKEANEALQRTLLMMNYDMKKTLSENVEVISEQENVGGNAEDQQIAIKLKKATVDAAGTDEEGIETALGMIKDKAQYDRVNALIPSYVRSYKNIQDMLNGEYETDNLEDVVKIKDVLSKIGIDLKYKTYVDRNSGDLNFEYKSITISPKITSTPAATKNTDDLSCVKMKSSDGDIKDTYGGKNLVRVYYPNSILVFWEDKKVTQYARKADKSPGAQTKVGTWTCNAQRNDVITTWSTGEKENNTTSKSSKKSVPSITDKDLLSTLNFEYTFPGDKTYVYDFVPNKTVTEQTSPGGTWYAKNLKTGKVFNITQNFPKTAEKLNIEYPSAANPVDKSPKNLDTTTSEKTTTPDVSNIQGKKLEVKPVGSKIDPTQKIDLTTKTTTMKPTTPDMSNLDIFGSTGTAKESIKKSLKKNLIEAKEKKENLMVETNIVEKRFNFIIEGDSFDTIEKQDYLVESVISEIGYLKTQGYTSKAINEGLFSMLGSLLGGGAKAVPAVFGEYIANWLTGKLGIPKNSYMNGVIVSLVGNLNIADYDRFFSDCRFASNKIADSLIEGYLVQLQNQKDVNSGASGFIVSALRNSVVDYFAEDKNSLIQILEDKIGEFICPKLSKLSGAISDKTDEMKAKMVA